MPRLLLVDDDPLLLRSLQKLLSAEGYFCAAAAGAGEARQQLAGDPFDLVLLDINLPDGDGLSLCRQIRREQTLPILLLTARSSATDKVVGLEVGADDYITKPFEPLELVARVRAHLRRADEYSSMPRQPQRIQLGPLTLDVTARQVLLDGVDVGLTRREFDLLHFMARHADQALASVWIFENVWGYDADYGIKALPVCIQRVRQKIEVDSRYPALLRTVRGFGYKLVSSPAAPESAEPGS